MMQLYGLCFERQTGLFGMKDEMNAQFSHHYHNSHQDLYVFVICGCYS